MQVCAQGLLLREAGYACDEGALWFAESRERVCVAFTDELVAATLQAASELRLTVAADRVPPPLDHSPKCPRCSLLPICLPDEVNWFCRGALPRTPPPAASPALPLYVQTPGARITKKDFTLVVRVEGEEDRAVELDEVSELVLAGPVSLTTPAVPEAVSARGRALDRTLAALLKRGLIAERIVRNETASCRRAETGEHLGLAITAAGLEAIGAEPEEASGEDEGGAGTEVGDAAPAERPSGKLGALIAAGATEQGATIDELANAVGWQKHIPRGTDPASAARL